MSLQLECPSCNTALKAPDSVEGKKILCPKCAYSFMALPENAPSHPEPRARSKPDERLQKESSPRRAAPLADRDEEAPRRKPRREADDAPKKSMGLLLPLLLVGGAGAFLFFVLAGVGLWWALRPSKTTTTSGDVAAAATTQGGGDQGRPQGDPDVMPAPVAADGGEEFVDLPARGEGLSVVPGLGAGEAPPPAPDDRPPPPPPQAPQPAMRARLHLFGISLRRSGALTQIRVNYRFTEGAPANGARYDWVVRTARNREIRISSSARLAPQGVMALNLRQFTPQDQPFQVHVEQNKGAISNVFTFGK